MPFFKKQIKITLLRSFVIVFIFFSTLQAKVLNKYDKAENFADYFSGTILLNESKYDQSFKFFKKLDGLEEIHSTYVTKYLYSLINSGNFNQAFNFSKKLEREKIDSFASNLIIGIQYLKNSKYDLSSKYFDKAKNKPYSSTLDSYVIDTLSVWSNLKDKNLMSAKKDLNQLDNRLENLKKIQNVFLNCFYSSKNTEASFIDLISDKKTDFSRYNYFYAKYLVSIEKKSHAKIIIKKALEDYPRNLLLNQLRIDLERSKTKVDFDCKKETDVIAELLYIAANALSTQTIYQLSNFYLNLSKFLNKDFHVFDTLLAENFYSIDDLKTAKNIYRELKNFGNAFKWYSDKQISRILIQEEKKEQSLSLLEKSYNELTYKGIYEIFDYAEFLKNNEEFEKSIIFYTEILKKIDRDHPLFSEVTDGRGVSFERVGKWDNAEKDLLLSLEVNPDQAYVINYLAYSWIEQGIKIEKSLEMLKKANKLKSNDPYIIDSLGWALFKLKRFKESKQYLQQAVRLMPADPIVNDHYGDVLWKNGYDLQARYYWNYVLSLEKTEKDLRDKIEKKLIKGL